MPTRRTFLQIATFGAAATALPRSPGAQPNTPFGDLPPKLAALERTSGGRLGVAVLNTGTGALVGHRLAERFPMCSTFKVLLVAAVLRQVDTGREPLDRLLPVPAKPLVPHSPLTEPHAGGTMTIGDLCHAALVESDNTATNLLLGSLGGPDAVNRFARSIGDPVTRLDRSEPGLNEAIPGDPRDTTSPAAMAADLGRLLLGDVLQPASRARLKSWMAENRYGLDRLRANLPTGWQAADKTGSNGETTSNDIAVYWPPDRTPPRRHRVPHRVPRHRCAPCRRPGVRGPSGHRRRASCLRRDRGRSPLACFISAEPRLCLRCRSQPPVFRRPRPVAPSRSSAGSFQRESTVSPRRPRSIANAAKA